MALIRFILLAISFLSGTVSKAQTAASIPLSAFAGRYQVVFFPSQGFLITLNGDRLILEIEGQGKTMLLRTGNTSFVAERIAPQVSLIFTTAKNDSITGFTWIQKAKPQHWKLVDTIATVNQPSNDSTPLDAFTGTYGIRGNPYLKNLFSVSGNQLFCTQSNRAPLALRQNGATSFIFESNGYACTYSFSDPVNGRYHQMTIKQDGPVTCVRRSDKDPGQILKKHSFYLRTGFTHADTLLGGLNAAKTCYDVLFYDLSVMPDPASKSITGTNTIRFRCVVDLDSLQVDLFESMKIHTIQHNDKALRYTRDGDAVFVHFNPRLRKGDIDSIRIEYAGIPQLLDLEKGNAGFIWSQDKNGTEWIESVSQGSGASTWWPCKDHLSDKPDSMAIHITVPSRLTALSNGQFRGKELLPGDQARYNWFVSYPMNTYDAVVYVGDYRHYTTTHHDGTGSYLINYYYLSDNKTAATSFYKMLEPVLNVYEKAYGPYPFQRDGFAIIEAPYPMEHQSAVSMGGLAEWYQNNYKDSSVVINTLWHETAHEWWGNNVTCSDYADFWIHESFATYSEILARKRIWGEAAASDYLQYQKGENKDPILGYYGVNDFHLGDLYGKGARMIITLQNLLNNDSLWFDLLRSIQQQFRYQAISSKALVNYINTVTGQDLNYFFEQYLNHASLPELQLKFRQVDESLEVAFRWNAAAPGFHMPVRATTGRNTLGFIYPNPEWQSIRLQGMQKSDFQLDRLSFYYDVKMID